MSCAPAEAQAAEKASDCALGGGQRPVARLVRLCLLHDAHECPPRRWLSDSVPCAHARCGRSGHWRSLPRDSSTAAAARARAGAQHTPGAGLRRHPEPRGLLWRAGVAALARVPAAAQPGPQPGPACTPGCGVRQGLLWRAGHADRAASGGASAAPAPGSSEPRPRAAARRLRPPHSSVP